MTPSRARGALLGALLLPLLAMPLWGQQPAATLPGWLAGCWRQANAALVIEEIWLPPAGGALMGIGRTIRQDSLVMWEHLVIRRTGGGLLLEASPSNQPSAAFPATEASDSVVAFENSSHDFPQVIRYERRGSDSLYAVVSGTVRDRQRSIEYQYARVACPTH